MRAVRESLWASAYRGRHVRIGQNLLGLGRGEGLAYVRDKARRVAERIRDRGRLPETIRRVNEAGHWAARVQSRRIFREHYFVSRHGTARWIVSNRTLGWERLVKGGIEIYDTPGHHADLVRDPRARVLARQLDDALTKAQAPAELGCPSNG